ncbi:chymotrypsin inhibitor Ani s 6-like [Hermetia illucens]|uniref:chymotrypsin inhibitor Ani s 6-like n=1 Tax=Hermetia illucens TaxID=343691 RepID=UPI0018CC6234|nr:chymotrypsin inhibitor Ani s 6-like [Hermetia illucens]
MMSFTYVQVFLVACLVALCSGSETKTCPQNEVYLTCGPSCQTECESLNKPCLIRHIRCPDGCYCIKNYARISPGGRCVPISQCRRRN